MSRFPYVAINPARIVKAKTIGTASFLHDLLVDRQTDAGGRVNYGRPIGYAWIRAEWEKEGGDPPPLRTLHRYVKALKDAGEIEVRRIPWGGGMTVRILASVKWADVPQQMNLFAPNPVVIDVRKSRGKAEEKLRESCERRISYRAKNGGVSEAKNGGLKTLRKEEEQPKRRGAAVPAGGSVVEIDGFEERRRVLQSQAEELIRKYPDLLLRKEKTNA